MLKLLTLLGLLIGSSVLGQFALPYSTQKREDVQVGVFTFRTQIDTMSDERSSYVTALSNDKTTSLNLTCSNKFPLVYVFAENSILSELGEMAVVIRFDKTPAWDAVTWSGEVNRSGRSAWMSKSADILRFSKAAYNAKQVIIRVFTTEQSNYQDFTFPLTGYFKAVKRLSCARAFGF